MISGGKSDFRLSGLLLLLLFFVHYTSAQDAAVYARKAANELAEGVLVVRVFTNSGKIRHLKSLMNTPGIDRNTIKKLQQQLEDTKLENDKYWNDLTDAFRKFYSYSKVFFMPDSLYRDFEQGRSEVFWDNERKIDSTLTIGNYPYFLMITGDNTDQLVLVNKDLRILDKPFPHRILTFLPSFRRIFNRKSYLQIQIKGFNNKLRELKS